MRKTFALLASSRYCMLLTIPAEPDMQPKTRRIIQAVLYEAIAVVFVGPGLTYLFDHPPISTLTLAVLMSTIAVIWSYVFNAVFERWESTQNVKGRPWKHRLLHGLGFEGGLLITLVPLMAYWLNITLLAAFIADLGVLAFFFIYAIIFTWCFDKVFGLPQSASAHCEA
ncbi:PACE efflux transporter [Thiofilum flexile]|uniref:PACE efflux transporter n=1 Tax=Thiofilum flexile TaxID=125627 RepID=UPI001B7FD410|nr:PACE efflux transporter [Thiofilum flexile]